MKKNIREYERCGQQFAYVLDAIYNPDSEDELTDKEKVKYFFDRFNAEYNTEYEQRRYPNLQSRVANYLQGLPSCIGIAFTYFDITEIGKSWGQCRTEFQTADFIENWFIVIALRLLQLKVYFNI